MDTLSIYDFISVKISVQRSTFLEPAPLLTGIGSA